MALRNSDEFYYDIIRKNIRRFRKEKGYTQQRLADETSLSMDYICEIESMKKQKSFSIATLGRIAEVLEIDIRNFFEE
jgi:transcriptional regulator with XRE-family HTH domain